MTGITGANIDRIVVRGTNWVGDAVMTVPALRSLRQLFPSAKIVLATRPWAKGLFSEVDFLDGLMVHEISGLKSVINQVKQWRAQNFDLAVLFPNSLESALVASIARVPFRIGYATDGRQRLLTHPLELPDWRSIRHEVYYYLNIVEQLQRWARPASVLHLNPSVTLTASSDARVNALSMLHNRGINSVGSDDRPLIALCPGSTNSRAKRWPTDRYAKLADLLITDLNAEVLLIGSKAEAPVSEEVQQQMQKRCTLLTGETNLEELVALLSVVDLLITNDTGPAHIASALNRPTLVIFGPTNPLTTRPFSETGEIVREPPDCAPCMLRDCPIDHRCMTAISPEQVFSRARLLLVEKLIRRPGHEAGTIAR